MNWYGLVSDFLLGLEHWIIAYVAAINFFQLMMMVLGCAVLRHYHKRLGRVERDALWKSALLPPVSILAPAYNEAATVRQSTRAMLKLRYPNHEVIVINDGSKDDTLALLTEEFRLYKSSRVPSGNLPTKPVRAVYESREPIRLIVIDKENGGKADSLNAGINFARAPIVAAVDSDSLIEEDALLAGVKPFLEEPDLTVAAGGMVRAVNGCDVRHGRVTEITAPHSYLALCQALEYLRAFLGARVAMSFVNGLLIISGAFGLFRRDAVIAASGFAVDTVGEDMELVVRLHEMWQEKKVVYRILFVPEPVCWTELPETWKVLQRQRNRWQRGCFESLWHHRKLWLNPRYGAVGMFAVPYFVMFEMLAPLVETLGYITTTLGLALGIILPQIAFGFFLVSVVFGILLSMSALALEELTIRRYSTVADFTRLCATAILENVGYRQALTLWRTKGLIDGIRGKQGWGKMERRGFGRQPEQPPQSRAA